MPSITRWRVGKYTYLNESVLFWDPVTKHPDSHKTRIGKIDRLTGEPVYLQEYLDKLTAAGHSVEGTRVRKPGYCLMASTEASMKLLWQCLTVCVILERSVEHPERYFAGCRINRVPFWFL